MPTPQPAIFTTGTRFHWFLHYRLVESADLTALRGAVNALRSSVAEGQNLLVGFGSDLAPQLFGDATPGLRPFVEVSGSGGTAVATQEDVFFWIHGDRHDDNFDLAHRSRVFLGGIATLARETPSWVYRDSRDLTGFLDGTANPSVDDARTDVAVIPDGEPGAGGSFVLGQRWIHNLDKFHAQSERAQEEVIGRTKPDSVELDPMPPTAHVGRVEIHDDQGQELPIFRRSVAYGTVEEAGLYFLAFTKDLDRIDTMLANMFGASPDGIHDRLVEFTTPVSGAYYYAPPVEALDSLT